MAKQMLELLQVFKAPLIDEADIAWACKTLDLPATAFNGPDGEDPRQKILMESKTLDIEACPGSGKTTLLVAKLAILARRWVEPTRGICVLSHTNVARQEIQQRLGNTAEGQRLLSYPHFIGTIHGFVNEFLAIPWLRSKGYPIKVIDNSITQKKRWAKIPYAKKSTLESKYNGPEDLKLKDSDFAPTGIKWGNLKPNTILEYEKVLQAVCKSTTEEGYHCYDDMFIWANELIDQIPQVTQIIRQRFPLLFIDEIQDNSEMQSGILYRVFMEGTDPVIRQRFGDSNQAIFDSAQQTEAAKTDVFPSLSIPVMDIPNSFRFRQDIADFANPLALNPQNLIGLRPENGKIETDTTGKHTIFLFSIDSIKKVLDAYGAYLVEVFSENDLRNGDFYAVGAVHRQQDDSKIPHSVKHYWGEYDDEISRSEPRPNTFVQYVSAGHRLAALQSESHVCVEKIAEGFLRLVLMGKPEIFVGNRKRKHRYMLELLEEKSDIKNDYRNLVRALAVERVQLTEESWKAKWKPDVLKIIQTICCNGAGINSSTPFLDWQQPSQEVAITEMTYKDNIYRFPNSDPKIQITIGSIHSVKGQTHTATLILETYFKKHYLEALKAWLLGQKSGKGREGLENMRRLKLHYVAMTRPSHLLCLAMREDTFKDTELETLTEKGWRIVRL